MKNINKAFIYCGSISLFAILASVLFDMPVLIAFALELGPLCVYFIVLIRAQREGLAANAVDSVYYFGFLITIFSLAASVLRVWLGGIGGDLTALVSHFGVGLLATGIALAFRLYLTAAADQLDKKDLDEAIESYIRRVDEVVSKVELSATNFEGLANSLEQRAKSVAEKTFDEFEISMASSAETFRTEISSITQSASSSIELFSGTVQRVAISQHVVSFDQDMRALSAGLATFSEEMRSYAKRVGDDAQITLRNAFSESIRAHSQGLATLTTTAKAAIDGLVGAVNTIDFTDDVIAVRKQMRVLASTIDNVTERFSTIEAKLEHLVVDKSASIVQTILDDFIGQMAGVSTRIEERTQDEVAALFRDLATHASNTIGTASNAAAQHVTNELQALSLQVAAFNRSLDSSPFTNQIDSLSEATGRIRTSLDSTAVSVERVVNEVAGLGAHLQEARDAIDPQSQNIRQGFEAFISNLSTLDKRLGESLANSNLPVKVEQIAAISAQIANLLGKTHDTLESFVSNLIRFTDKVTTPPERTDVSHLRERLVALSAVVAEHEGRLKVQSMPALLHAGQISTTSPTSVTQSTNQVEPAQAIDR